jgi:peptidoglycan DL-endopeptidase CwlO
MNFRESITPFIATLLSASIGFAGIASSAPVDSKRRQAAALEASIAANGERTNMLSERLNGARLRVAEAQAGIAEAQRRTDEAQAQATRITGVLSSRASTIYKGAATGTPLRATSVKKINELGIRSKYAAAAAEADGTLLETLQRAREELAVQKAELERQKAAAAAQRDAVTSARAQVIAANAEQRRLLSQVKGDIASLVSQEQARRAAAVRNTTVTPVRGRTGNPERFPNIPAPSAGAATAIAFARAQLGKPYRYATAGPDTFDCSGLTMRAWGAAGVRMAHFSGAQYRSFPRIPLSELQPGDLVFRGPNGSAHVALYIGGGMILTAPQTGDVVKIARMGNVMGAVRPG